MARSGLSLETQSVVSPTRPCALSSTKLSLAFSMHENSKASLRTDKKSLRRAKEKLLEEEENDDESYDPTDKLDQAGRP